MSELDLPPAVYNLFRSVNAALDTASEAEMPAEDYLQFLRAVRDAAQERLDDFTDELVEGDDEDDEDEDETADEASPVE